MASNFLAGDMRRRTCAIETGAALKARETAAKIAKVPAMDVARFAISLPGR
jgi:hypothetical protein